MLTLRAAKGPDYYERPEFARDDYYAERGQVAGRWAGRGAEALGLSGAPAEGALGMLLDGRDPATGAALAGTARRAGGNVAFDLTFAAPKSVSVLAAVGDERGAPRGARRARAPASPPRSTTWSARPASCAAGATGSRSFRPRASSARSTSTRWPARAIPTCTPTW